MVQRRAGGDWEVGAAHKTRLDPRVVPDALAWRRRAKLLIERRGFGIGLAVDLLVEDKPQVPVGAGHCAEVAVGGERPHQAPVRGFPQRVPLDEPAQQGKRGTRLAARRRLLGERLQTLQIRLLPNLALRNDPILVAAFEQRPAVERDGPLQRGQVAVPHRQIERDHIDLGVAQVESQGTGRGRLQPKCLVAERPLYKVYILANIAKRLAFGGTRPERPRKPLPRYLFSVAKRQEREQPVLLAGVPPPQRLPVDLHVERTEHGNPKPHRSRSQHSHYTYPLISLRSVS